MIFWEWTHEYPTKTKYIKLLNRRYITNALIGNAERRGRNHVVEFCLNSVDLLNCRFSHDVTKIQTTKLLMLPIYYFNDV